MCRTFYWLHIFLGAVVIWYRTLHRSRCCCVFIETANEFFNRAWSDDDNQVVRPGSGQRVLNPFSLFTANQDLATLHPLL